MTVRTPTKTRKVHTVLSTTSKLLRFKEWSCKTAIAVGFHLLGSFYLGKEFEDRIKVRSLYINARSYKNVSV